MAKTVVGLFDDFSTAQDVVQDLVNNGFSRNDISVIANNASGENVNYDAKTDTAASGMAAGAGTGAVVGGIAGLLVGLGALAIPGIGPILAAGPLAATLAGAGIGAVAGGLIGALVDLGVPEEEAQYYAEGVRRGGTLVTLKTDDDMVNTAVDIMNRHGAVDIDERAGQWRKSGWTGWDANAKPYTSDQITKDRNLYHSRGYGEGATLDTTSTTTPTTTSRASFDRMANQGETKIPVVEEHLHVNKEAQQTGGVRVHTNVTEKPVEKDVQLREEHVTVERRPVDRPVSDADMNAFREGTIEVTETVERPVVEKHAKVVEEVVVGKDVNQRTQTVRDSVRKTDVNVENMGKTTDWRTTGTTGWDQYDNDFRTYHTSRYANMGDNYRYDRYAPAYQYGYELANDPQYSNWDWTRVEPMARQNWERSHPGNAWDDFKDSIHYAWDKIRGRA